MKFSINIPFKWIVTGLIVVLVGSILFFTCRNRKEAAVVLHPTQQEIDQASKSKKEHDLFVVSTNAKIASLQKQKDSIAKVVLKKDIEIQVKSQKITALTKQAAGAKAEENELLFVQSCDQLIPQVNDLVEAVDQLQQDNRNVQDSYDSLLSTTSLKSARLEYDYSELKERFDRTASTAKGASVDVAKYKRKAERRFIAGPQAGVIYSISKGSFVPYIGVGISYRIFRLPL